MSPVKKQVPVKSAADGAAGNTLRVNGLGRKVFSFIFRENFFSMYDGTAPASGTEEPHGARIASVREVIKKLTDKGW